MKRYKVKLSNELKLKEYLAKLESKNESITKTPNRSYRSKT